MQRERMTAALIEKAELRKSADLMVQAFLANGGKVRRIPNQGIVPKFSKHYCDPRNRKDYVPGTAVRGLGLMGRAR